jgi:hypothetical protein
MSDSVEYALTSRSSCKGCGSTISEGSLRIGHKTPRLVNEKKEKKRKKKEENALIGRP